MLVVVVVGNGDSGSVAVVIEERGGWGVNGGQQQIDRPKGSKEGRDSLTQKGRHIRSIAIRSGIFFPSSTI